jgi:Tfp pilus assembly protein PilF
VGVLKLTALVQLASKQRDAAHATYERVLQIAPNDFESLSAIVQIDLASGRVKEATARMDAHMKTAQPTVDLLVLAARVRGASGDVHGAETLLRKAIETDTDRLQAYTMLGQIYAREGRLDDAKAQYLDVLKRDPKSISAGTIVGMVLEQQGKVPEAEKQYQQVLSLEANAAVAANNLAWLYVSSNRQLDEALQLAQTAVQQLPDEPNIHDTLGWIYYRKNMAAQAIPHLERSTRISPFDPVFRYHLGMALVQSGDWNKAREELRRAFSLRPTFEGAVEAKKALDMIGA